MGLIDIERIALVVEVRTQREPSGRTCSPRAVADTLGTGARFSQGSLAIVRPVPRRDHSFCLATAGAIPSWPIPARPNTISPLRRAVRLRRNGRRPRSPSMGGRIRLLNRPGLDSRRSRCPGFLAWLHPLRGRMRPTPSRRSPPGPARLELRDAIATPSDSPDARRRPPKRRTSLGIGPSPPRRRRSTPSRPGGAFE